MICVTEVYELSGNIDPAHPGLNDILTLKEQMDYVKV